MDTKRNRLFGVPAQQCKSRTNRQRDVARHIGHAKRLARHKTQRKVVSGAMGANAKRGRAMILLLVFNIVLITLILIAVIDIYYGVIHAIKLKAQIKEHEEQEKSCEASRVVTSPTVTVPSNGYTVDTEE